MIALNISLSVCLLVMTISLIAQALVKARNNPLWFYWGLCFLILFVLVPLVSNLLFGSAKGIRWDAVSYFKDPCVYYIYAIYVVTFVFAYGLLSVKFVWNARISRRRAVQSRSEINLVGREVGSQRSFQRCIAAVVVAGFVLYVAGTGQSLQELWLGSRFSYYKSDARVQPLINVGLYLLSVVSVFAYLDARYGPRMKMVSLFVYIVTLLMVGISGGRKWLLFILSGILAGYYDRRSSIDVLSRYTLGAILILSLVFFWQFGRALDWNDIGSFSDLWALLSIRLPGLITEGDLTYFYRASLEAINANVAEGVSYPLAIIRRVVLLPLPNEWTFGAKLPDLAHLFAVEIGARTDIRVGNTPPGFIGIWVLSFGWFGGLIWGPIIMFVTLRWLDILVSTKTGVIRDVIFANAVVLLILLFRGSEGGVYFMVFNIIVCSIVSRVCRGSKEVAEAIERNGRQ